MGRRLTKKQVEATIDRIGDCIDQFFDRLNGTQRDTLSRARQILEDALEGDIKIGGTDCD